MEMDVPTNQGGRRLPVYLLLDCSGSMEGAPIQAVQMGVEMFMREVQQDPFAAETVHVGIITFASTAQMVTDGLVSINKLQPPQLSAGGSTALGAALRELQRSLDSDIRLPGQTTGKGDWKALVFILTDGRPNDTWEEPRNEILRRKVGEVRDGETVVHRVVHDVITVGCGPHIDEQTLKAISIGPTFYMDNSDASFKKFFKWMSQSVQTVSKAVSQSGGSQSVNLPPPDPTAIQYIP